MKFFLWICEIILYQLKRYNYREGYTGKRSNFFISSNESSQLALFEKKICASGRFSNFVSKHPAGTTRSLPSICKLGSAEPQVAQKAFT